MLGLMPDSLRIFAEFETLGEIEVNSLVGRKVLDDTKRAYAMRWLNDKAMARVNSAAAVDDYKHESQLHLARRAVHSARMASLWAGVAAAAAVASAGAAYLNQRPAPPVVQVYRSVDSTPSAPVVHHPRRRHPAP